VRVSVSVFARVHMRVPVRVESDWRWRKSTRAREMLSPTPTHMGWLRLVGSLKLHVSFAEYSLFYMALLQKRPIILRSLLIVATPYLILQHEAVIIPTLWVVEFPCNRFLELLFSLVKVSLLHGCVWEIMRKAQRVSSKSAHIRTKTL